MIKRVKVIQQKEVKKIVPEEVPVEVLASAIVEIGKAMKKLTNSKLTKRAIYLLIQDNTSPRVSMPDIRAVIESLETLERTYIKKQK